MNDEKINATISTAASLFVNLAIIPIMGPEIAQLLTREFLTISSEELNKRDVK